MIDLFGSAVTYFRFLSTFFKMLIKIMIYMFGFCCHIFSIPLNFLHNVNKNND